MKIGKTIGIVGIIIVFLGTLFHLQGQAVIGPESSFMYSNPEWITHGFQISVFGIATIVAGIILVKIKKT